jgi:hypothetical protein
MKPFSLKKSNYDIVEVGWTKAQALQLFGEAKGAVESTDGALKIEVWTYRNIIATKKTVIVFDESGNVASNVWAAG